MAVESKYTLRKRLVTSTWVHERPLAGKSKREIQMYFIATGEKDASSAGTAASAESSPRKRSHELGVYDHNLKKTHSHKPSFVNESSGNDVMRWNEDCVRFLDTFQTFSAQGKVILSDERAILS
ncbi:hypothetical protein PR048_001055 [Dryococelus australis]|uniref:Uncharacterized protein n=1 Tax=Dryococelus australis TaxID=614101 RepID=A0ABQ9IIQ9_9NEOP|nr:hypothetical protein PR048_001055 [Dryococelus australis]